MSLSTPGPWGRRDGNAGRRRAAPKTPRKSSDTERAAKGRTSPEEIEAEIDSNQPDPARPRRQDETPPGKPGSPGEPSEEEVRPHDPPPLPSQHDPTQPASPEPMRPGRDPTRRHTPDKG